MDVEMKMKKSFFKRVFCAIIFGFLIVAENVYVDTLKLEKIVELFNNSSSVKDLASYEANCLSKQECNLKSNSYFGIFL